MPENSRPMPDGDHEQAGITDILNRIQERVDRAEATWSAVLRGADATADAVQVRAMSRRGDPGFHAAVERLAVRNCATGRPDPRDEAKQALIALQDARARLAEIQRRHR